MKAAFNNIRLAAFYAAITFIPLSPLIAQRTQDPLRQLINEAIAYSRSGHRDEFSEPPSAGINAGANIHFSIPLNSSKSTLAVNYLSSGYYNYTDGLLSIHLDHWYGPLEAFEPAKVISGRSYMGTNAFGVGANIRVETILKGGISVVNVADPSRLPNGSDNGRSFLFTKQISGSDARNLVSSLRYEIFGKISTFSDGRSVKCRSGRSNPPTRERPNDFTYHFCTVAVEATKVTLVNSVNGHTLRSWEGSELAQAGRE